MNKIKILTIGAIIASVVFFIFRLKEVFDCPIVDNKDQESELYEFIELRKEVLNRVNPVFVIALCNETKGNLEEDFRRQMDQTFVLLKSAALLTSKALRFIVLVDKDKIFEELLSMIKDWPKNIRNKILLEKGKISYPDKANFKTKFRLCASERLFISEILPSEDAVVYLDTDMIFLKSPQKLWEEFAFYNSSQMCGLSPSLYMYHPKYKFPVYGNSGLNAGVWMMNLTRMRRFQRGWKKVVMDVASFYRKGLTLFDQDIANIIFSKNQKYLYELSCRWNYRDNICNLNLHPCLRVESTGIFLLHGNALNFYVDHNQKFKVMFREFLEFDVGRPLKELLDSLKISLKNIAYNISESKCLNLTNIDEILTKSLEETIL